MTSVKAGFAAAALGAATVGLTACGGSVSVSAGHTDRLLSASTVAKTVRGTLTGQEAATAAVTCGSLKATVGATQDCDVTIGDDTTGLHLTVDSVKGSDVHWKQSPFLHGSAVASTVATATGASPSDLECPDLPGTMGASVSCKVLKGSATAVDVTVTSVAGLRIGVDFKAR